MLHFCCLPLENSLFPGRGRPFIFRPCGPEYGMLRPCGSSASGFRPCGPKKHKFQTVWTKEIRFQTMWTDIILIQTMWTAWTLSFPVTSAAAAFLDNKSRIERVTFWIMRVVPGYCGCCVVSGCRAQGKRPAERREKREREREREREKESIK